jgi:hypothetical protein
VEVDDVVVEGVLGAAILDLGLADHAISWSCRPVSFGWRTSRGGPRSILTYLIGISRRSQDRSHG